MMHTQSVLSLQWGDILEKIKSALDFIIFGMIVFGICLLTVCACSQLMSVCKEAKSLKENAKWNIQVDTYSYYVQSYKEIDISEYGFDDTVIIFTDQNCINHAILKSENPEIISLKD